MLAVVEDLADRVLRQNRPVIGARKAAAALLAKDLSEPELQARLETYGLTDYDPTGARDMTYREWLTLIVERTTLAIDRRSAAS
ncbi:MAG: hypothetical protein MSC31_06385 [Solirubrobacteraceae bacterium MAG38_C4-C5]|nr:hypothetical protein [Candidatus Siliceabacter maunaloa]